MSSFGLLKRRIRYGVTSIAIILAAIAPGLTPALVSAAQLTSRSIALSSSSKAATGVTYTVNFTPVANAGSFVVDFCENSPIFQDTCTSPATSTAHGFSASSAASTTTGFTTVVGSASKFEVDGTMTAGTPVSVAVTGITNPNVAETLYARVITYDLPSHAASYTSTNAGTGVVDNGGVSLSITDSIGVSGAVLESMTFCTSGATITADCASASSSAPTLKLGETVGNTVALTPTAVSTGDIFAQISTNASSGAVVSLKSDALGCGGLLRAGAPGKCDIGPALVAGITAGQPKFGVKAIAGADTGTNPNGTFEAINGYNNSTYALNWVTGDATGVTSPFGDQILDTNSLPANNKNMKLTFGASVSNSTPAGSYSTDLSLIATGKF